MRTKTEYIKNNVVVTKQHHETLVRLVLKYCDD